MDITFNNVLEGARQYFQGLPSPVASNDNPHYNSESATNQSSATGPETSSGNHTNNFTNSVPTSVFSNSSSSTLPSVTSSTSCSSSSTSTLSSSSNSSSLPYWSQPSLSDKAFAKTKHQYLSVKPPSLPYENTCSTIYNGNFNSSVDHRRNAYQSQNHSQQQLSIHTSQTESYSHHYSHLNQSSLPRSKGHNLPPIATISNRHCSGRKGGSGTSGLLGSERSSNGSSLLSRKPEYSLPVDPKYSKNENARYIDPASTKSTFNHFSQKYLQKQNSIAAASDHPSRNFSVNSNSSIPVPPVAPSTTLTSTQRPHVLPTQHNLPQVPLSIPQLQSQHLQKHSQELHNHQQQQPPQHHLLQQQQKKQLQFHHHRQQQQQQHLQQQQPHPQLQTHLSQHHQQLIQHSQQQNQVTLQQQHLPQLQNQNQQQHQSSQHQHHLHQHHLQQSQLHPQLQHQQIHPPHQVPQQQQQQLQPLQHSAPLQQQQSHMFRYAHQQTAQIDNSQELQKHDSTDVYSTKAQSQQYGSNQTVNVLPASRVSVPVAAVPRVPNPPGSSGLITNVPQNTKSVIAVRGAGIRNKRESPLDLSVKTVRQSADSTAKDDGEIGFGVSSVSPCGDVVAVGGVMQPLAGEPTGGALPVLQQAPAVPGTHGEKIGGLQNTMHGVAPMKTDFRMNAASQSRPVPTSSYSVENQRLSMLKPGAQQQSLMSFQSPVTSLPHMNTIRRSTHVNYNTCESREQARDHSQYKYSAGREVTPYNTLPGVTNFEESVKQNSLLSRKTEFVGIPASNDTKHNDISIGQKRMHEGRHSFPTKIPRIDTWRETIDQQIEQKLSAYTRLQHQEQTKLPQSTHTFRNETLESQNFQNYQPSVMNSGFSSMQRDETPASVQQNGITQGSKQQYLPQLELNGDQHTIRKLLTSKSDPILPGSGFNNNGSNSMLSILRSSLEIKEARISELQSQLQQNAQMHQSLPPAANNNRHTGIVNQVTVQPHPGMQSSIHPASTAHAMGSHKLHVPKAVDSILLDLESPLENDASVTGCQQMQQVPPHHRSQQLQQQHHQQFQQQQLQQQQMLQQQQLQQQQLHHHQQQQQQQQMQQHQHRIQHHMQHQMQPQHHQQPHQQPHQQLQLLHHQQQQPLHLEQQPQTITQHSDSPANPASGRSGDFDKFAAYLAARIRTKAELKQVSPDVEKLPPFSPTATVPQSGLLDTSITTPPIGRTPSSVSLAQPPGETLLAGGSPPKLTREKGVSIPLRRKVVMHPEDGTIPNSLADAADVAVGNGADGAATAASADASAAVAEATVGLTVGVTAGAANGATAGVASAISALPIISLQDSLGLRSSSETSVFDFKDTDSEGEMPVLERQTLYMRRDRKLTTKVPSRCPVPSEAVSTMELESTMEPSEDIDDIRDCQDVFVQGPASPSDAFWSTACDQFLEQLQAGSGTRKRGRKKKIITDVNTEIVDEKLAKECTFSDSNDDSIAIVKTEKDESEAFNESKEKSEAQVNTENEISHAETNGDDHNPELLIDSNEEKTKQREDSETCNAAAKVKLEKTGDNLGNDSVHVGKINNKGELKQMKTCRKILKEEESNIPKNVYEIAKEIEEKSELKDDVKVMKMSVSSEKKDDVKATKESSSVLPVGRRRKWKRRKHFGKTSQHTENCNELLENRERKRSFRNENNKKSLEDKGPRLGLRMKRKFKASPRLNEVKQLRKYKALRTRGQKDDSEEDIPLSKQRLNLRKTVQKEERDIDDEISLAEIKARLRKGTLNKKPMRGKRLRRRREVAIESSTRSSSTSESGDSSSDGVPQESVAARVHRRKGRNVAQTGMRLRPRNASSVPRNRKLCSQNSENSKKEIVSSASQNECKQFGDGSDFHPGWEEEVYKFKQSLRMPAQLIVIPKPPRARHISASLPDLDPSATSLLDSTGFQNSTSSQQHSVCSDQNANSNLFGNQSYKTDDGTESEDTNLSALSSKNGSNIDNNNSLNVLGVSKYTSKRILQKKCKKGSLNSRSSSTDIEASITSEGGSHQIWSKLRKSDLLKSEAKVPLSKIENDGPDSVSKDRIKRKVRESVNNKAVADNLSFKSRTRTQTRLLQQRPTIRAVFGEDRPASAPPCTDVSRHLSENKRSAKVKKVPTSVGVVTRGRAGLRTAAMLRSNKAVLNSKRHLLHSNKTRNMKLLRAIAKKKIPVENINHFSSEPNIRLPQGPHSAHLNSSNKCLANSTTIGKRIKIRTVRRKFRSGFDYIRKKKKQQKKDPGDVELIKERKKAIISRPSSESVQDVQAEIRGWVINKGLGETLLHRAARLGYTDVAAYCLEKMDSAPSPQDNAGYTPLHEACSRGHLDIARLLLMYGADVSASALGGVRPLHEAAENGFTELVRLLLSYGADPLLATYSGVAPLALATDEGSRWLLQHHLADVQGLSATSWTFHGAASCLDPVISGYDPLQDPPCASPDTGEDDEIDIEISEISLPVLYQLRGEPVKERWVLFQDLAPLLRVKSRDVLLRQISPGPGTDFRSIMREFKMADFLEQAHCCHVIGSGEKVNIRASKVALVKYNDKVRELLGVEKVTVSSR